MGRCGRRGRCSGGRLLRDLLDHAARCGRMCTAGDASSTATTTPVWFGGLVLEHAVRLAAATRLILPEARRGRTGLFDFHVAHRAGAIVALTFRPQLAGFLVAECRRFVAVLAV